MRTYVAASVANGRHVVGIMGGSSIPRDAPAYRVAAQTAKALSEAGFLVATGGGLGIMEAGNLGAYFAGRRTKELDGVIEELIRWPTYRRHEAQYVDSARSITARWPAGAPSLAVATWRFDDETISQFATDIAKLFQNSVREDGLLSIADAGVAYFDGGFGTLREIFQDLARTAPPPRRIRWPWSSSTPPCTPGPVHPSISSVPAPLAPRRRSTTSSPLPTQPTKSSRQ